MAGTRAGPASALPRRGRANFWHRRRRTRVGQGSRDPRRHRGRGDPRRFARRPGGVRREPWVRQHAVRSAAAREWPSDRCETRHARRRRRRPCARFFRCRPAPARRPSTPSRRPSHAGELVPENNARSALVQPPTRPRRVLLVEGAPGFEHGFLKRAWASDPASRSIRSCARARTSRAPIRSTSRRRSRAASSLTAGYPATREALFRYDALVLANVEAHQLSKAELELTRSFVGERGGGLLVLGARSFAAAGPRRHAHRGRAAARSHRSRAATMLPASATSGREPRRAHRGRRGASRSCSSSAAADETRKRWEAVPPLAAIAPLGGPRPGASVLAVTSGPSGTSAGAGGRAAIRRRPLDGFYRRGIVAMAHAHAVRRSFVRHVLEAGAALARASGRRSGAADRHARRRARRRHSRSASSAGTRAFEPIRRCRGRCSRHCARRPGRVASRRAGSEPGQETTATSSPRCGPKSAGVFKLAARVRQGATTVGHGEHRRCWSAGPTWR